MKRTIEDIIKLASEGYCNNRLFAEVMDNPQEYEPCLTDCTGYDKNCLLHNKGLDNPRDKRYQNLDKMPIVEVFRKYNELSGGFDD